MAYVPDEAIDRLSELSKGARHLYVFLARCRNQSTGKCCPSVNTTMSSLGCNRGTVYTLRSELIAKGWAEFDGDNCKDLFGFKSLKNQTTSVAKVELISDDGTSLKIQTKEPEKSEKSDSHSLKNQTFQSEKSDSHIRKNQQIEPAKEYSSDARAHAHEAEQQQQPSALAELRAYQQAANAKPNLGKYEFSIYEQYHAEAHASEPEAKQLDRARWSLQNGRDDAYVTRWLERKSQTPAKPSTSTAAQSWQLEQAIREQVAALSDADVLAQMAEFVAQRKRVVPEAMLRRMDESRWVSIARTELFERLMKEALNNAGISLDARSSYVSH